MRSLVTLSVVVLFALGCTPTGPDSLEICAHLEDVVKRELDDSGATHLDEDVDKFRERCVADVEKEKEKIGAERFDALSTCVMAAPNFEGLMKCDQANETVGGALP
jgi:hypothetical protein